jgi:hypothetical protein
MNVIVVNNRPRLARAEHLRQRRVTTGLRSAAPSDNAV